MWNVLGLLVFCSLVGPLQGVGPVSPGLLGALSPAATSRYFATVLLRDGLIQSHILAIQFLDAPHREKDPEKRIKAVRVVRVQTPVITVKLKGNGRLALSIKTRVHLTAKFVMGTQSERVDIIVDVVIKADTRFVDFSVGVSHIKVEVCKTEFSVVNIICPSRTLLKKVKPLVQNHLAATLPKSLCLVVDVVVKLVNVRFLYTTNAARSPEKQRFHLVATAEVNPNGETNPSGLVTLRIVAPLLFAIGSIATIHYQLAALPLVTPSYLGLEINIVIRVRGRFLTVPANHFPVSVPTLKDNALCLGLTQASLDTILSVMMTIRPQEFMCTPQLFSGAVQLTDTIAELLSHNKCPKCSGKSPLKITITVIGAAVLILEPKKATMKFSIEIAFFAKDPHGTIKGLFVLKAHLRLSVQVSVHECKLIFSTTLSSLDLVLVSSEVGHVSVSSLVKIIHHLVAETFVPQVNDCLNVGVPLPSFFNIKMAYPAISIVSGMLALCV